MASSAYLSASGRILTLIIDADTGTFTSDLSVALNPATAVNLTASGGNVSVYQVGAEGTAAYMNGVVEPDKYPWCNLSTNQAKIRLELDRQIHFGETVTVTITAAFITDGATDSLGSIDLNVTNNSLWHDEVGELISDTTKIVYVDPTLGNDTNAAAVNGVGYYVKTDAVVGSEPSNPAGSVVAYATLGAAASVFSDPDTGCILLKGGETFDGSTQFIAAQLMLGGKGGISNSAPMVYAGYGTGDAILEPSSTGSLGSRAINFTGDRSYMVMGRGLDARSGLGCIQFNRPGTNGSFGHHLLVGVKGENIVQNINTQNDGLRQCVDVGIINCHIDNSNTDQGLQGNADWDDFTYREFELYQTSFSNIGLDNGQDHPIYLKMNSDTVVQECIFYNCNGAPLKCDTNWGVEFSRNIMANCWSVANIESNGDSTAGVQVDRTEDTQTGEVPDPALSDGAYSKWVTVRNNVATDYLSPANATPSIIYKYGQAYYSSATNNIMVSDADKQSVGGSFQKEAGAGTGYTRDGYGCKFNNNTIVLNGTTITQQYGIRLQCATVDTYPTTNNDSKGHHNYEVLNNVVWVGSGATGTTRALDVVYDTYADALAAGRLDGEVDGNLMYRESGSETNFYRDESTDYSMIAGWEAVVADAANNLFGDPMFSEAGYQISNYASDLDSLTLANFMEAMIDNYRDETLADGYKIQNVQAAILSRHQASTSGKGAQNWATIVNASIGSPSRQDVVPMFRKFIG